LSSDLAETVTRLGRSLRARGIPVGPSDAMDAALALRTLRSPDRDDVRRALLVAFKIRPHERERFDAALAEAAPKETPTNPMERAGRVPNDRAGGRGEAAPPRPPLAPAQPHPAAPPLAGDAIGYGAEPLLRRKPFEACAPAELAAMERALVRLARGLATRRSRRLVPARAGGIPDLRRSLRRAVGTAGEVLSLAKRSHPVEAPRLVVLCDTSGSMDPYARLVLPLVLAIRRAARTTEVFAFNTSLVRLTPLLARGRTEETLERLAELVPDWSGGTRIGECLAAFVADHLRDRVDGRTVVIVLSDGLDRGDTRPLEEAMRAIHARAREVVWLNPLMGDPRYEPTARGMAAALPFVDHLLPANDLVSLERLIPLLTGARAASSSDRVPAALPPRL
jgi:uncharacterized protein with von Willebrand factor type A (vWA) domain